MQEEFMHDYIGVVEPLSVTVAQAAELLGFKDTKSVYRLIREGYIRARKSGRIYLVSYASLKSYVEGR
ncbi:helix-turn-helix domain-containing protein [Bifidobacterium callitrichidarum]